MRVARQDHSTFGFEIAQFIVDVLNRSPEIRFDERGEKIRRELKKLIDAWLSSGPDTLKMVRDNTGLLPHSWKCFIGGTNSGRLEMKYSPGRTNPLLFKAKKSALSLFFQLTLTDDCDKRRPSGPCACGCGQYFLKASKHRKIYCKGHGSAVSASAAMKLRQAKERAPRVHAAKKAIRKYQELRKRSDWRTFVEVETGISRRTLGMWVERGFIQSPKGHKP